MWPMQEMQFFLVGFIFLELAPYPLTTYGAFLARKRNSSYTGQMHLGFSLISFWGA